MGSYWQKQTWIKSSFRWVGDCVLGSARLSSLRYLSSSYSRDHHLTLFLFNCLSGRSEMCDRLSNLYYATFWPRTLQEELLIAAHSFTVVFTRVPCHVSWDVRRILFGQTARVRSVGDFTTRRYFSNQTVPSLKRDLQWQLGKGASFAWILYSNFVETVVSLQQNRLQESTTWRMLFICSYQTERETLGSRLDQRPFVGHCVTFSVE